MGVDSLNLRIHSKSGAKTMFAFINDLKVVLHDLWLVFVEHGSIVLETWIEHPMTFVIGAVIAVIFMFRRK